MNELTLRTENKTQFIDITSKVQELVTKSNINNGICHIFIPHTTAAITINENADPDVIGDMTRTLNKVIPLCDNYSHAEGNSAAHIKASLLGFSVTVFVKEKQLALGIWQGIYFAEFDGPRTRKIWVRIT